MAIRAFPPFGRVPEPAFEPSDRPALSESKTPPIEVTQPQELVKNRPGT